jgi:hypothetical protein
MPNDSKDVALGAPNLEGYKDNTDGTVTDNVTGLLWEQNPHFYYSQTQAIAYCQALSLAGYTGWRLPSMIELLSLLDNSKAGTFINTTVFPNDSFGEMMSSTPVAGMPSRAWYVMFQAGATNNDDISVVDYGVRCVH